MRLFCINSENCAAIAATKPDSLGSHHYFSLNGFGVGIDFRSEEDRKDAIL